MPRRGKRPESRLAGRRRIATARGRESLACTAGAGKPRFVRCAPRAVGRANGSHSPQRPLLLYDCMMVAA